MEPVPRDRGEAGTRSRCGKAQQDYSPVCKSLPEGYATRVQFSSSNQ